MQRPMTTLIPVHDIEIELDCAGATGAYSVRGIEVGVEETDGGVKLTLPELEFYDLIVIELG